MSKDLKIQLDVFQEKEDNDILSSLTEEQKQFVLYEGKKSVIVSSTAGSGKSFCCVQRLKFLLKKGVDPKKIIFFSFTTIRINENRNYLVSCKILSQIKN